MDVTNDHCFTIVICLFCLVSAVTSWPVLKNYDIWGDGKEISNNFSEISVSHRNAKVLNFFPVPVEEECLSTDGRRRGVCMNTYECRIQGGKSYGSCALGFGVCCVFTVSCDTEVINNITYFVNPDFPDLSPNMKACTLKVKKIDSEISQFRLDFIHFHLGQPNRRTGICEDDVFTMTGGSGKEFTICGLNSGQHVYYDVDDMDGPISITMKFGRRTISRLWEVRVIQVPFNQRAPVGCLQYHMGTSGTVQTLNFADNGRRLANQDYSICMRQELGMCSIAYEPCDENSFKIGSGAGGFQMQTSPGNPGGMGGTQGGIPGSTGGMDGTGTAGDGTLQEDIGSGDGAVESRMMCVDRIVMPCDSDDFIMPGLSGVGSCDIIHCGSSFCPEGEPTCRLESSVTPFTIGVQFGLGARNESPEDNLGMCLTYEQLPCSV